MTDVLGTRLHHPSSGVASISRIHPPQADALPTASVQGTLALDLSGSTTPVPARRPLRMVPGSRAALDAFAARFSAVVVEVLGGDRGPQQLLRWTTLEVYEELVRRSQVLAGTCGSDQRLRRLRAQVRSVHLFCPSPTAAELSVHVRHGHRSRAIAARLEERNGRWVCVALQLG